MNVKISALALASMAVVTGGVGRVASAAPVTFDEYNVTTTSSVNVQLTSTGVDFFVNVDGFGFNVQAGPGQSNGDKVGIVTDGTQVIQPQGTLTLPIATALPVGATVGPNSTYSMLGGLFPPAGSYSQAILENSTGTQGEFPASPERVRDFGFEIIPNGSTTPEYGYVAIRTVNLGSVVNDPNGPATAAQVISVTYDPTGAPVTVTAVPEPASAGLLAAAGAGLLARRRRRTA